MLVNLVRMFFAIILLGGFVACSSSSHVSNSGFIQKRKYQSGFHIASRSKNNSNLSSHSSVKKSLHPTLKDTLLVSNDVTSFKQEENEDVVASIDNQLFVDGDKVICRENTVANHSENSDDKYNNSKTKLVKHNTSVSEKMIKKHILKKLYSTSKKSAKTVEIDAYMLLLIILACIIPPLAVLLYTDVDWKKVAIALILCLFFYFPAIIYALLVLFDVL